LLQFAADADVLLKTLIVGNAFQRNWPLFIEAGTADHLDGTHISLHALRANAGRQQGLGFEALEMEEVFAISPNRCLFPIAHSAFVSDKRLELTFQRLRILLHSFILPLLPCLPPLAPRLILIYLLVVDVFESEITHLLIRISVFNLAEDVDDDLRDDSQSGSNSYSNDKTLILLAFTVRVERVSW
jgi:hypothetical protein